MEAAEVLEQLCILSFTPKQIKIWEGMDYDDEKVEGVSGSLCLWMCFFF
jgi:hypothetical protein